MKAIKERGGLYDEAYGVALKKLDEIFYNIVDTYNKLDDAIVEMNGGMSSSFTVKMDWIVSQMQKAQKYGKEQEIDPDDFDYLVRFHGQDIWPAQTVEEFYRDCVTIIENGEVFMKRRQEMNQALAMMYRYIF
jgi:hypothetical protein